MNCDRSHPVPVYLYADICLLCSLESWIALHILESVFALGTSAFNSVQHPMLFYWIRAIRRCNTQSSSRNIVVRCRITCSTYYTFYMYVCPSVFNLFAVNRAHTTMRDASVDGGHADDLLHSFDRTVLADFPLTLRRIAVPRTDQSIAHSVNNIFFSW